MKKKSLILLLAGAMVFSLAACGGDDSSSFISDAIDDNDLILNDIDDPEDPEDDVYGRGDDFRYTANYAYVWMKDDAVFDVVYTFYPDGTWSYYTDGGNTDEGEYEPYGDDNHIILHGGWLHDECVFTLVSPGYMENEDGEAIRVSADLSGNKVYVSDYGDILIDDDYGYVDGPITDIGGYWEYEDADDSYWWYFDGGDRWYRVDKETGDYATNGTYEFEPGGDVYLTVMIIHFNDGSSDERIKIYGGVSMVDWLDNTLVRVES